MSTPFRQGLNKVYLPNIIFRMIRSPNLQPNQVAFRVPPKCNKFDIHSYLTNIYGVNVQEVRTMNYLASYRNRAGSGREKKRSAYKKAIVTVDEPFEWPAEPEWCQLELQQNQLGTKNARRKMNGWRVRAPEDERAELKRVNEALQERMAAESGQQKKK